MEKTSEKLGYLYGIKRFLTSSTVKVMMNSYVHSVADYYLDISGIHMENMMQLIQAKIDRFLINIYVPTIAKIRKNKEEW